MHGITLPLAHVLLLGFPLLIKQFSSYTDNVPFKGLPSWGFVCKALIIKYLLIAFSAGISTYLDSELRLESFVKKEALFYFLSHALGHFTTTKPTVQNPFLVARFLH